MATATPAINVDSYVKEGTPNKNYGQEGRIIVSATASNQRFIYLFFDRKFPDGAYLTSATLNLYLKGAWTGNNTVTAKALTENWKENKVNWQNRPAVRTNYTPTVAINSGSDKDLAQISLTDLMQEVSNGLPWKGLRLEVNTNGEKQFYSSESNQIDYRPTVSLLWDEGPLEPTDLVPSGGQATSLDLPILMWTFRDVLGDVTQAQSQVQIDNATDFATPLYDSTMVANTKSEWDLSATAYGGFSDNTTYYWRVRVQSSSGLTSEWSEIAELERRSKGTSTLSAPGATVEELVPDVTHSALSGRTQAATEYFLYEEDDDGNYREIYHRHRLATTATTWSIPDGLIRFEDHNYKVVVRIYDDIDRATTPGDPPYVEDDAVFQFSRNNGITGTSNLVVVASGPGVELEWERASQPDFWALRVDSEYMDHDSDGAFLIPGADLFVSGTTYSVLVLSTLPRGTHNYEVEAVEDTAGVLKHSETNADEDFEHDPSGIWLVEPTEPMYVRLIATEEPEMKIGEELAVHFALSGRKPIVLNGAIRGYEGRVTGIIDGETYKDNFEEIKGQRNTKQLRLIFADVNVPILLGEVSGPTPMRLRPLQRYYEAEFDFYQNAEFTVRMGVTD